MHIQPEFLILHYASKLVIFSSSGYLECLQHCTVMNSRNSLPKEMQQILAIDCYVCGVISFAVYLRCGQLEFLAYKF